jgi:hypothetical protein
VFGQLGFGICGANLWWGWWLVEKMVVCAGGGGAWWWWGGGVSVGLIMDVIRGGFLALLLPTKDINSVL